MLNKQPNLVLLKYANFERESLCVYIFVNFYLLMLEI